MAYYKNERALFLTGYEIYFTRFADSILVGHFNDARDELVKILSEFTIHEAEVIKGGGGRSTITQALAGLFDARGWNKKIIETSLHVEQKILPSKSHEVDHYKDFAQGSIGLEIEWNNKDPFYDRDLENFRKIHQIGELSLGVIVTRGFSLQKELLFVIERFISSVEPFDLPTLLASLSLSDKAKDVFERLIKLPRDKANKAIAKEIYNSKFGMATTHMEKLLVRLDRGVGDPCPFILIGMGKERLVR
jgi:hypothetical protein